MNSDGSPIQVPAWAEDPYCTAYSVNQERREVDENTEDGVYHPDPM